jgi:hypothetical protein
VAVYRYHIIWELCIREEGRCNFVFTGGGFLIFTIIMCSGSGKTGASKKFF